MAISASIHLTLSFSLCSYFGPVGFIFANIINMLGRIIYRLILLHFIYHEVSKMKIFLIMHKI